MKLLLSLLLFTFAFGEAFARDIPAGPIWNNNHAQRVCPRVCADNGLRWNGQWRTTRYGRQSVCGCERGRRDDRRGEQKFVLHVGRRIFQGQSTLPLKRMLRNQYGINVQNFEIDRVRLVAKSRQGRGTARLKIGQWESYPETIQGNPYDFNSNEGYTFDRIMFRNNARFSDRGVWQILMRGNIKVKKVVVFLKRDRDRRGGW